MIEADLGFHGFIHALAKNELIAPLMQAQWSCTQRVMGDALLHARPARDVWTQHEEMLGAVIEGDGERAEDLARRHIAEAAAVVIHRIQPPPHAELRPLAAIGSSAIAAPEL
jgi:DNA-binding FadR family transcriptional regulator